MALAWLTIMIAGLVILGVMLATSPGTVTRFWEWSRDLPLWLQVIEWVVLLPWMVAIAIWESDWATGLRVSAISVAAAAWILGSWPGVGALAMTDAAHIALVVLDLFVAVTAIGGGIALVTGLEGDRFSPAILRNTPFRGFVGPGLILAIAVGGSATAATTLTLIDRETGAIASILAGAILMGFIAIEARILADQDGWSKTEIVYFITGLLMALLGAMVWAG